MKRLLVFVALALVLCFGLANGQTGAWLGTVEGEYTTDTLVAGAKVTMYIGFTNVGSGSNWNYSNGFEISSPDGAQWSYPDEFITDPGFPKPLIYDSVGIIDRAGFEPYFTVKFGTLYFHGAASGQDADTVAWFGAADAPYLGLVQGHDQERFFIPIQTRLEDSGKHICLDSSWFPPGGTWKWAALEPGVNDTIPGWSGKQCWVLYNVPDLPPEITNCLGLAGQQFNHCPLAQMTFTAADGDSPGAIIRFEQISGPGGIDAVTGVWSWASARDSAAGFYDIVVAAKNINSAQPDMLGDPCTVNFELLNAAPAFVTGCEQNKSISTGDTKSMTLTATDADDCDDLQYTVEDKDGAVGPAWFVDNVLYYTPDDADALMTPDNVRDFTVRVSDGALYAECIVHWTVLAGSPYVVSLDCLDPQVQGMYADMGVNLHSIDPVEGIGGFKFLVAYDATALSFQKAEEGEVYDLCGWEYFTYRYGPDGNCDNGCPTGMLMVMGTAESNNGTPHPACDPDILKWVPEDINDEPDVITYTLANLVFLVSNDRTLECQAVPVRFFWMDCTDNTISNWDGSILGLSTKIYDPFVEDPIQMVADYPTMYGAQDDCLLGTEKGEPVRNIDFFNGCVRIICGDEIDDPGDININGIAYEIADAVMFTNYFLEGMTAFGLTKEDHQDASIAASDVNKDGIPLSVADLVYLIRVVVGDAQPYVKPSLETSTYTNANGVLSVSGNMGAAYVVVAGDVTPTLLADMEMQYRFDGANTRIIVTSLEPNASFTGEFLQISGDVVSIEMATYLGAPVVAKAIPANYGLKQNYPNPFNPTTTFTFDLASASDWNVTVYNVTGQVVETFSGYNEAGTVDVVWDASSHASGIYFYKLEAGNFTATKKAVLLK